RKIMKNVVIGAAVLLFVVFVVATGQTQKKPAAPSDVKIRQRMHMGADNGAETTLYIKGQRMRNEIAGSLGITTVVQCDLKRTLTINEKTKTYFVTSTNANASTMTEGDGGA